MKEWEIECHTCHTCRKYYPDHSYLCMDDVCIDCHGGMENFIACEIRHDLLLYFPTSSRKEQERYCDISKQISNGIRKYLKASLEE